MSTREEYRSCMRPYITGTGKSKQERQMGFCIGAKRCSGKAKNEQEAREICSRPKEPKPVKVTKGRKGQSCEKQVEKVAECVVNRLVENDIYRDQALNINSIGAAVTNALIECQCPKE